MDDLLDADIVEGFALLGSRAQQACEAVTLHMSADPTLRARVDARHALMARAFADEHPDACLPQARRAGRRSYLIALLVEAGRSASDLLTSDSDPEDAQPASDQEKE